MGLSFASPLELVGATHADAVSPEIYLHELRLVVVPINLVNVVNDLDDRPFHVLVATDLDGLSGNILTRLVLALIHHFSIVFIAGLNT